MPLETGTYFTDLVPANPAHTDGLNQGDGHLRLIKSTLQASFKNWTSTSGVGSVGYLSATQAQLDNAVNVLTGASGATAFPAGSAAAPSIAFVGDPDSGWYKAAEDQWALALNGVQQLLMTTTAATFTQPITAPNNNNGFFVPPGTIHMYQGGSPPTGYAWMNGGTVTAASNPTLASIYGSSGGNVTLPDWRCYIPMCTDNLGGSGTTGRVGGTTSMGAVVGETNHTLSVGEMPSHAHSDAGHGHSDNGHSHGFTTTSGNTSFWTVGSGPNTGLGGGTNTTEGDGLTISTGFASITTGFANIQANGGGGAHNNVQLSVTTGFIIKLG